MDLLSMFKGQSLREELKSDVSGVFVHLDVAGAVRLVWSHTVVSSIGPVCR